MPWCFRLSIYIMLLEHCLYQQHPGGRQGPLGLSQLFKRVSTLIWGKEIELGYVVSWISNNLLFKGIILDNEGKSKLLSTLRKVLK